MGKGSRKRRRKRRRDQKARALARYERNRGLGHRISLNMIHLEVAHGHDGFLRGSPEPVVLLGAYAVEATSVRSVARFVYRFSRPGRLPCKVAPREASDESFVTGLPPGGRVVIVAIALEEDSGRGVAAVFADLEAADEITAWNHDAATPAPMQLHELGTDGLLPDVPHRVQLLFGDRDPSAQRPGDDWVDAALVVVSEVSTNRTHRLRFVSPDGRNDWTAELHLGLRRA